MRMPTVGAGFHARPALVDGQRGCARMNWCAGCARWIGYVERWTDAGAPWETRVQAVMPNVRNRSTAADKQRKCGRGSGVARETGVILRPTAAHRGRCALRRVGKFPHRNYAVRHPEEGASGTPPPTVVARFRFQRSREVQFIKSVTFFYVASSVTLPPVGCTVLGAPWLRDCRVSLAADVRLDRLHPRHPRRARLASTAQRIQSRGHSPRTILYGRSRLSVIPSRAGVEDKPLRWIG